jgi:hypothetical protein
MYNLLNFIDYINTRYINIQPIRGWRVGGTFSTGFPIHIQPLRGWRYSLLAFLKLFF